MPLNVLIAPDKFKGTLTAREAARAIARGWHAARPKDQLTLLPITDGGDGFGPLLSKLLGTSKRQVTTIDAAHRKVTAPWWLHSRTAIIESANIIGHAMLPPGKFHPFQLDTHGLARALERAARAGATHCLLGIGGSATNDGGFGLAQALGWRFTDRHGHDIAHWPDLARLHAITPPHRRKLFRQLTVAVDVQNPLLGVQGASRVYGPQKGLRSRDLPKAELALRRLTRVWQQQFGKPAHRLPGAGAAGGLGFGLHCFAGGVLHPGFDLFADAAKLPCRIKQADIVITGEGAMDQQTVMGKGVGELARHANQVNRACIGLAGQLTDHEALHPHFDRLESLTYFVGTQQAIKQTADSLTRLSKRIAGTL